MKAEFFPEVMFALGKTNFDTIMFINSIGSKKSFTSVKCPSIKLSAFQACRSLHCKGETNKKKPLSDNYPRK